MSGVCGHPLLAAAGREAGGPLTPSVWADGVRPTPPRCAKHIGSLRPYGFPPYLRRLHLLFQNICATNSRGEAFAGYSRPPTAASSRQMLRPTPALPLSCLADHCPYAGPASILSGKSPPLRRPCPYPVQEIASCNYRPKHPCPPNTQYPFPLLTIEPN